MSSALVAIDDGALILGEAVCGSQMRSPQIENLVVKQMKSTIEHMDLFWEPVPRRLDAAESLQSRPSISAILERPRPP
jgi:hypothetical protein